MQKIPNLSAYQDDIDTGAADFASGLGIDECPHPDGNRAAAWCIGWLNEMQNWLHVLPEISNKAGEILSARIAEIAPDADAEDDDAA